MPPLFFPKSLFIFCKWRPLIVCIPCGCDLLLLQSRRWIQPPSAMAAFSVLGNLSPKLTLFLQETLIVVVVEEGDFHTCPQIGSWQEDIWMTTTMVPLMWIKILTITHSFFLAFRNQCLDCSNNGWTWYPEIMWDENQVVKKEYAWLKSLNGTVCYVDLTKYPMYWVLCQHSRNLPCCLGRTLARTRNVTVWPESGNTLTLQARR